MKYFCAEVVDSSTIHKMTTSSKMPDDERLALAAKLDAELDEFIDGLEKRRYTDGWPEDRWEEEMAKHPFFMKQAPESNENLSPLMEGLQKLKYDPEENTPVELAKNYKEDGNFNFKHKNYRLAILGYTEGIKVKCDDDDLNATLYNNRSASQYFLKNYRSSLSDCQQALKLKPTYTKVLARAADCSLHLGEFDLCFQYCNEMIAANFDKNNALRMKREAENKKNISERDQRKKEYQEKKNKHKDEALLNAIIKRGIKLDTDATSDSLSLSDLEPKFPGIVDCQVHFSASEELIWPVIFLYPEYKMTDFIQQFPETSILAHHLAEMFIEFPEWDIHKVYKAENLNVYYEGIKKFKLFKVDVNKSLLDIMKEPYFQLRVGTPSFIILVKDSKTEKSFLQSYT